MYTSTCTPQHVHPNIHVHPNMYIPTCTPILDLPIKSVKLNVLLNKQALTGIFSFRTLLKTPYLYDIGGRGRI